MDFDPVLLARLQFAFTIIFHIIFPSFTIGLAAYIATLMLLWLKTGAERFHRLDATARCASVPMSVIAAAIAPTRSGAV